MDGEMKLLTAAEAKKSLINLIKTSKEISFTVAWATPNTVTERLLEHADKIRHGIIGTHLYQTSPQVLEAFASSPVTRYWPPSGPLFHPKLYLFRSRDSITAVIGSHNLTAGAFDKGNIEASLLIETDTTTAVIQQLEGFIESHWTQAQRIANDDFLYDYRVRYDANVRERAKIPNVKLLTRPKSKETISPFLVTWEEFVQRVRNDQHHSLAGRLDLLRTARELFLRKSFAAMTEMERKAIAGTYGKSEAKLGGLDWAWFGSMQGG